jgi:hypothetical protein
MVKNIAFLQLCESSKGLGKVLGKWSVAFDKLPADKQIYEFIRTDSNFGVHALRAAHGGVDVNVGCWVNGQLLEEGENFSLLDRGKTLAERTCIVCVYAGDNFSCIKNNIFRRLGKGDLNAKLEVDLKEMIATFNKKVSCLMQTAGVERSSDTATQEEFKILSSSKKEAMEDHRTSENSLAFRNIFDEF